MNEYEGLTPAEAFDQYFGPALFEPWAPVLLEYAAPRPNERVLDLACATGTLTRHVAQRVGEAGRVVGVDISPSMLAVARAHPAPAGAHIQWLESDALALNLPNDSFDLVVCQQGLQFFPERSVAMREMLRVLSDGGRAVLSVWQSLDRHPVYQRFCEAEARYLGVPINDLASPWSLPDAGELRNTLVDVGFRRVEVMARALDVSFPSADRFIALTLFAATAFLPEFDWSDEASRSALIETVSREMAPVVDRYRNGDGLTFPTYWHIAVGEKAPLR